MIVLPLTKGYEAVIDDIDADLAQYKWRTLQGKRTVYAARSYRVEGGQITVLLHRVILGRILGRELDSTDEVDHEDLNGTNNTRNNLRLATTSENACNRVLGSNNTTGVKGVTRYKNRFRAQIKRDGKPKHLGIFDTLEEAAGAYDRAAKDLHGEFAHTNNMLKA